MSIPLAIFLGTFGGTLLGAAILLFCWYGWHRWIKGESKYDILMSIGANR